LNFPAILHMMLKFVEEDQHDGLSAIVSWQPHGRCFVVHRVPDFVRRFLNRYELKKSTLRVQPYLDSVEKNMAAFSVLHRILIMTLHQKSFVLICMGFLGRQDGFNRPGIHPSNVNSICIDLHGLRVGRTKMGIIILTFYAAEKI
jgi:hypothetical protein